MNDWVNWHALWQIVVLGLVCGAGLPALFAVGLVALNTGNRVQTAGAGGAGGTTESDESRVYGGNPVGLVAACLCFAIVLGAIGYGIYLIVASSHGS
ncbi:MAG TPA: hypothetical protein VGG50_21045 [Streptosporangiaceae bacterium]|jgi:hypothetical protein